jgi:Protein of unknown function (DUF1549)
MSARQLSQRLGGMSPSLGPWTWRIVLVFIVSPVGIASAADSVAPPPATPAKPELRLKEAADFGLPQVRLINLMIRQGWMDHDLVPAQPATDGEWCRRVYLDVLGRVPTVDELNTYLADRKHDRRARLVDRLLGEEYAAEYSRNWATIFTNLLIGRTGGTARRSLTDRAGMQQYLREAFQYNKPYDELTRELITATGSCRPGDEDFNGAANFLADKMEEGGVQATAKTSQLFLGMATQCTQAEPVLGAKCLFPANASGAA